MYLQEFAKNNPWAIQSAAYESMILQLEKLGIKEIEQFEAAVKDKNFSAGPQVTSSSSVAVIPISGPIMKRSGGFLSFLFGGTSVDFIRGAFREAMASTDVDGILLNIDSPGGVIAGVDSLSQEIFEARGGKPIVAFSNGLMASSAYWIGSAADKIMIDKTAFAGSIGVLTTHEEFSKADKKQGIKRTILFSGKYKAIGNDIEPLSDLAKKTIQGKLDYMYGMFVETIARNRGKDNKVVDEKMAQGQDFIGQEAVDVFLADYVGTFEAAISATRDLIEGKTVNPKAFSYNNNLEGGEIMKKDELKAKHPDLVNEIIAEATVIVKASVTKDLQAKFDTEKADLETGFEAERQKLTATSTELGESMKKLEKKDAIRSENELQAQADRIWDAKLTASDLSDRTHDKVRKMVSHDKFVKDGVLDTQAFADAIDAEIKDWTERVGATVSVMGAGSTVKGVDDGSATEKTQNEADDKDADTLFALSGAPQPKSE